MKAKVRMLCRPLFAMLLALSSGVSAYAETPREELVHAFYLLKTANADYDGHRVTAMQAVEAAGHDLGLDLKGDLPSTERQWKSDDQLREAERLLTEAEAQLVQSDHDRVAARLSKAVREINMALNSRTEAPPAAIHAETPREELAHAFYLVKTASADYNGHRVAALHEIETAGRDLRIELKGDLPTKEQQWKSDDQLREARRLLTAAMVSLQQSDHDRIADRVEKAIRELNACLREK